MALRVIDRLGASIRQCDDAAATPICGQSLDYDSDVSRGDNAPIRVHASRVIERDREPHSANILSVS